MSVMEQISQAVIKGEIEEIERLTHEALNAGNTAQEILNEALIPAMDYVGDQMQKGLVFIPEVLLSARTMQTALNILKPHLSEGEVKMRGRVVLGTVKGDLHDIGKNLVGIMLQGAGFEVYDLGKDVPPEAFVKAVREKKPDIIGMSALLTTTMQMMKSTIDTLREAGVREQVKVMVGGAPVTEEFAKEIGADGYAPDAALAVELAKKLLAA